ncbi:ABC transporter ATP-binding protein [Amycolatopsis jejuensis]|uniref:ABC transporter ATP-binding protein n=1 Tax=Amycolatopsis jejuensis TaxID=330084 RepID=UPI00068DBF00|nr:ABC transporter ATP-binding protein [Amycolatopsis jejuensis]
MTVKSDLVDVDVRLGGAAILHQVSLSIPAGAFLTLLGPSGSGKTTTLNVLAGFVKPQSGHVLFDGQSVERLPPEQRSTGIVFQDYALFPHLTVGENIAFPLRARRMSREERRTRIENMLDLVELPGAARKHITALSGGQRQRVALARALVFEPRLLLLDEPLAALDKHLRETMQRELRRIQKQLDITTVAVTHDQAEALVMSDYLAIMRDGRIEQVGTPREVYAKPDTRFVATFLGEANIVSTHDPVAARLGAPVEREGDVVIRPEDLHLTRADAAHADGHVRSIEFHGSQLRVGIDLGGAAQTRELTAIAPIGSPAAQLNVGDPVEVSCDRSRAHVLAEDRTPAAAGVPG